MVAQKGSTTSPNVQEKKNDGERNKISEYEQSRNERVEQNLRRMQKLGIFDLSLELKSVKPITRPKKTFSPRKVSVNSSPSPSAPPRRSSRLQNSTPVSYSEADLSKKDEKLKGEFWREEGSRPEVYTEEHEKLLGSTEMSWTLFVDGVGKDGKRIYDPVNGKTCHQCRQKTLGHRTHCSSCSMVQGQFCGDCLYMRYGEHVLEANQNPNWICPVCRGICNCSLCRQSKGWPPTGPLYRKISSLGFKSVAHYLIQTRRAETETGKAVSSTSVIRSEQCSHIGSTSGEEVVVEFNRIEGSTSDHGGKKSDDNVDATKEEGDKSSNCDQVESRIVKEKVDPPESPKLMFDKNGSPRPETGHESQGHKDSKTLQLADKHFSGSLATESSPNPRKTSVHTSEPDGDSIGGRLRQRSCMNICLEEQKSARAKDISVHVKLELENISSQLNLESSVDLAQPMVADSGSLKQMGSEENGKEEQLLSVGKKTGTLDFLQRKKPTIVSVKEESSRMQSSLNNKKDPVLASPNPKRKHSNTKEVDPDSIGGRLRQRRCRSILE